MNLGLGFGIPLMVNALLAGVDVSAIGIFDISGRQITTLQMSNGKAVWNADGNASGVYFARALELQSGAIKLVLVK